MRITPLTLQEIAKTPKNVLISHDETLKNIVEQLEEGLNLAKKYEGKSDYTCYDELRFIVKKVISQYKRKF